MDLGKNLPFHDLIFKTKLNRAGVLYTYCASRYLAVAMCGVFNKHQIHLFLYTIMGNFQFSFIIYIKMFSELIQCVILPSNSTVCSMHRSRFDKNDVYLSTCVCLMVNHTQYNSHDNGCLSLASLPKIS